MEEKDPDSGFMSTELFYLDLANLPPEALAAFENGWFFMLPLQYNYSFRPDVSLITIGGLMSPDVIVFPEPVKYPLLFFPKNPNGTLLDPGIPGYPTIFFLTNLQNGRRVFLKYGEPIKEIIPYVEPSDDFLWLGELKMNHETGINAVENGHYRTYLNHVVRYMDNLRAYYDAPISVQAPPYMFQSLSTVVEYLKDQGEIDLAEETINNFINIFVDSKGKSLLIDYDLLNCYVFLANCNIKRENYIEAERLMQLVISIRPTFAANYLILGIIYNHQNLGKQTLESFQRGLELDPYNTSLIYQYSQALAKYSAIADAAAFLTKQKEFLDENGLYNAGKLLESYRDCLLLPPNTSDLVVN
jgi:tetratricopeptide (TPR) repeat protein